MEKNELIQIADLIAAKIPVDKIYGLDNEEMETCHLVLLMPPIVSVKLTEFEPFVKMVTHGRKDITFAIYLTSDVKGALKKGNLFFHVACIENNLLYNKPDSPNFTLPTSQELLSWKNEALNQFNDGLNKTTAFLEGADFYHQKNEPGLTLFMLHQAIELTFRALELAIIAKEKKTHGINVHQSFIVPFVPQLGWIFPADTPEEKEILRTLNDSYSAVRYEQNHKVEEKHIPILFERVALLQKRAMRVIDNLNAILDEKEKEALTIEKMLTPPENTNSEKPSEILAAEEHQNVFFNTSGKLKEVITLIIDNISPEQIYIFGNKIFQTVSSHLFLKEQNNDCNSLHYDLLAISSVPNPFGHNVLAIANSIDGITVNLFIHSRDEIVKKLEAQDQFFAIVIKKGTLVYSITNPINHSAISLIEAEVDRVKTLNYASRRLLRATTMLKAIELIKDDVYEVSINLLAQSLEQTCLGLIYNFLGYAPNLHSLSHLLNTCKIFWPEKAIFFPMDSVEDKRLLTILSNSHTGMRYTVGKTVSEADLNVIYERAQNFILQSEEIYLSTLSDSEIVSYQS